MLAAERRKAILKRLREQGAVQVPELSQEFQVSPSTIRRDLEWLADRQEIERTYGGAIAADEPDSPSPETGDVMGRIGRAAADLVAPGETVFVGPGPLCEATARYLRQRSQVTVLTNSLEVAWILYQESDLSLILTGGPVTRPDGALVGQLAQRTLETLRADRLIIEVTGVSPVEGLTEDHLSLAEINRSLLNVVAQVVVLCAPDQLGRTGAAWLGPVSEADIILTGRDAPSAVCWDLSETGVKVTLV